METAVLKIMTREEKQLLLKDLCARIPYKPKVKVLHVWNEDKEIEEDIIDTVYCVLPDGYINTEMIDSDISFMDVILYLRPISSMTEEEKTELDKAYDILLENLKSGMPGFNADAEMTALNVDFYNSHHLDYRGLIEKGLAVEASEDMYRM